MAVEPRTLAPPERRQAEVIEVKRLGAYHLLSVRDTDGPPLPRPGQFYMLTAGELWGGGRNERPYLPRAFSFARAHPDSSGGAELLFLLEDIGPGTHRLGQLGAGDPLMLLGPLGVGFRPPAENTRPLLVGGGIGVAPLLCLHDELLDGGVGATEVMLGFRGAYHARAAELFEDSAGALTLMTDDGSAGRRGFVTEPLVESLGRDPGVTVYACGPPQMLEAVRELCGTRSVTAQLALESGMACGYGACFGCVVHTRSGYVRICLDGPVLEADLLTPSALTGAGHP